MSISASWEYCLKNSECCYDDPFAGARERWRSGSRWSARSDARTNDLEAVRLATQNASGCQWRQ